MVFSNKFYILIYKTNRMSENQQEFDPGLYFKKRSIQVRLNQIISQHEVLELEEEQLLFELDQLTKEEEPKVEKEPKKLKKTNDQPSRDSVKIQNEE